MKYNTDCLVQAIVDDVRQDNDIQDLLEETTDIYSFVTRHYSIDNLGDARRKILQALVLQTIDFAYFIRDQAEVRNFCRSCI